MRRNREKFIFEKIHKTFEWIYWRWNGWKRRCRDRNALTFLAHCPHRSQLSTVGSRHFAIFRKNKIIGMYNERFCDPGHFCGFRKIFSVSEKWWVWQEVNKYESEYSWGFFLRHKFSSWINNEVVCSHYSPVISTNANLTTRSELKSSSNLILCKYWNLNLMPTQSKFELRSFLSSRIRTKLDVSWYEFVPPLLRMTLNDLGFLHPHYAANRILVSLFENPLNWEPIMNVRSENRCKLSTKN